MKAWELLGETHTPDGTHIRLARRDDEYVMLANGKPLMSSRTHGSEEALATLSCADARAMEEPRVLVPSSAIVTVAELVPAVIEWNRASLAALTAHPLKDHRVRIEAVDVGFTLRANPGRFDVVLLDVDNGPAAFTAADNAGLYDNRGVAAAHAALRPGGTLAVWSAWEDRKFEQRLRFHGFDVEVARVRARLKKGGPRHTIFLAHKRSRLRSSGALR